MKQLLKIILIICIAVWNVSAQDLKLVGNLQPGSLVIGSGDEIAFVQLDENELPVSDNSIFVFGFDRDAAGEHLLKVKMKSGKVYLKRINLPARKYKIQHINNMKQSLVSAPSSELERIKQEREITTKARAKIGEIKSAMFLSGFTRPVKGGRISSLFGSQRILNGEPKNAHNGLDIAAPRGTPVYAMADGVVRLVAEMFYYSGNNILIDHGLGLNSFYLHMSKMVVTVGDTVHKGQKIGEIGTTGRSTGPHLHWGVQWFDKRVDPAELLLKPIMNQFKTDK